MRLEFHQEVASDIARILDYYEDIGEPQLAEEFYAELKLFFHKAAVSPQAYAVRHRDIRRVKPGKISISFSLSYCRRTRAHPRRSSPQQTTLVGDSTSLGNYCRNQRSICAIIRN